MKITLVFVPTALGIHLQWLFKIIHELFIFET